MANHESLAAQFLKAVRRRLRGRHEQRKLDRAFDRGARELRRQAELRHRHNEDKPE